MCEVIAFSSTTQVAKPNTDAYTGMIAAMKLPPSEIVFLDDRARNVAAATESGLVAHQWVGAAEARGFLIAAGVALPIQCPEQHVSRVTRL